jgi:drug/metabolite transporter (DMT)-like permease
MANTSSESASGETTPGQVSAGPAQTPVLKTPEPGGSSPLFGIALKLMSLVSFMAMVTIIKLAGQKEIPIGEIVFFRSAFATLPVIVYMAARGVFSGGWKTRHPLGHLWRGVVGSIAMACNFLGITLLPLPDAIAIGYAMPLMTVIFAAIFLGEKVRLFRWTAVAVGICGVAVISFPKVTLLESGLGSRETLGLLAMLGFTVFAATASILVRRLVQTEETHTIVLYFSLSSTVLSLLTLPFGWVVPDPLTLCLLMVAGLCGGGAQILLTQSYRYADVSTIAPFEYASIIFGLAIGYFMFGETPTLTMLIGTVIVVSAGIAIIFREHRLGLERRAQRKLVTPQG